MPKRGGHLFFVVFATVILLFLQWNPPESLMRAEIAAHDTLARWGRLAHRSPQLEFLAIDDSSVSLDPLDLEKLYDLSGASPEAQGALQLMSRGWPWSREVHGLVLDRLMRAGARTVIFDLTFPKETPNDPPFRMQLDTYRDRVVVAGNFVAGTLGAADAVAPRLALPVESLIPETSPKDDRIGFDNFWTDIDQLVRSAQFRITMEQVNGYYAPAPDSERYLSIAARAAQKAGYGHLIPPDLESHLFRFAGGPGTFAPRSAFEIFVPSYWKQNYADGEFFRDKIVIVGAAGNWQQDEHLTPFGIMPGAELHLNALNALLRGEFLQLLPQRVALPIVAAFGAFSLLLRRLVQRPMGRLAWILVVSVAWIAGSLALYSHASILVPCVIPFVALVGNGFVGLAIDVATEQRERSRLRRTLERYVSRNVVREMIEQPEGYMQSLGGMTKPASILFSDVRNFTRLCANAAPHALVGQLNEYLSAMVECVFQHGGTLDKFIGDAVMAVWGNTRSDGAAADAQAAVRCALAMRTELDRLNARWRSEGRLALDIGIAVNHGEVVVGNIGSPHRMEFTVIGDAVNITWRLQERTKLHPGELIVGEEIAPLIAPAFSVEPLGSIVVGETITVPYGRVLISQTAHPSSPNCTPESRQGSGTREDLAVSACRTKASERSCRRGAMCHTAPVG